MRDDSKKLNHAEMTTNPTANQTETETKATTTTTKNGTDEAQ